MEEHGERGEWEKREGKRVSWWEQLMWEREDLREKKGVVPERMDGENGLYSWRKRVWGGNLINGDVGCE